MRPVKVPTLNDLRRNKKGRLPAPKRDIFHLRNLLSWLSEDFLSGKFSGAPLKVGIILPKHCGRARELNMEAHALARAIRRLLRASRGPRAR